MGRQDDKQGTLLPGETTDPIPDPITAGEAMTILGISTGKMAKLLSDGILPWRKGLDERKKIVSKAATMKLKASQPDSTRDNQARGGANKASSPTQRKDIYLIEWLKVLELSYQEVARRSKELAATQQGHSTSSLAQREETLRTKGVSLPTIRKIANKQQHPLQITVQRLAEALGVTPEQLLRPPEHSTEQPT